jgi:hypothetical protein
MKVVGLSAMGTGRLYSPGDTSWYSILLQAVNPKATVRPEGSEIEPAPLGIVTQCLDQLRDRVSPFKSRRAFNCPGNRFASSDPTWYMQVRPVAISCVLPCTGNYGTILCRRS